MTRFDHSDPGSWCRRAAGLGCLVVIFLLALCPSQARAALDGEAQFILNSFSFLIWGALVMWMCAGFTMLEAGSVRTKNASVICLKNIGLYSIAGLTFYLIGYNIMYVGVEAGGWIGSFDFLYGTSDDEIALLSGREDAAAAAVITSGRSTMSDWFFQMVFVATTASIVSGTLAERVKLWSFFVFITVLTTFIYPIVGAWTWGGGWLSAMGFQDFAGSTIVHSTGGWAALAGALVVGPRKGKFSRGRRRQSDAAVQRPCRDARRLHPLARLVRLQRRLATRPGRRRRRGRAQQHLRQHQSRRGRGRPWPRSACRGPFWGGSICSPA